MSESPIAWIHVGLVEDYVYSGELNTKYLNIVLGIQRIIYYITPEWLMQWLMWVTNISTGSITWK